MHPQNHRVPTDDQFNQLRTYFSDHRRLAIIGQAIRDSIDFVLDGATTGRFDIRHAGKLKANEYECADYEDENLGRADPFVNSVELTFLGFKIEQLVMRYLGLRRGQTFDASVEGIDVDIKWSLSDDWMFGRRIILKQPLCLLINAVDRQAKYSVGLIRVNDSLFTPGKNSDQKKSLSAESKKSIDWIARDSSLPPNELLFLPPTVLKAVLTQPAGQARVNEFCRQWKNKPFGRNVLKTLAQQHDPGRRVRRDQHRYEKNGQSLGYRIKFVKNPLQEKFGNGFWDRNLYISRSESRKRK